MTSFGSFIKTEREKRNWTQTDFGAKLGINSTAISRIENDNKQLSASRLGVLAEIFKLDIKKIKELYYADKFAREAYHNNCPDNVFAVAEEAVKYFKAKNAKQSSIEF
ncbi:MAG: helix-turn-helix transcriptional regulator [Candidatus Marinimicrobia bacterium]|nr:helix-turn-helix transcriptional regulator [Candidatus Neomarinimicrobiota bacterium]